MKFPDIKRSILQEITTARWLKRNVKVYVKRDDLIHEEISGNKWRKLMYNVELAKNNKNDTLITFGGAFSNHLVATACACKVLGLKSVGIVRGEELSVNSNDTLKRCADYGMKLEFVSRELYNLRYDKDWWRELQLDYPNAMVIPEGGANFYGMVGCQEIWKELPNDIDRIFVAQGTTTTSCGVLIGAPEKTKVHVVPVLKGFDSKQEMTNLFQNFFLDEETTHELFEKLIIEPDYHFGGYGKYTPELLAYITEKFTQLNLKLDPIYTAKSFFAMEKTIEKLDLKNEKIVFLNTGGLQGAKGIVSFELR